MIDVGLWIFVNVIVPLSPLGILLAALRMAEQPWKLGTLFGDGFLYFYGIVMAAGLLSDLLKDFQAPVPKVPHGIFIGLIVTVFVLVGATLLAYFMALVRHHQRSEQPVSGAAPWLSMAYGIGGLALTLGVRRAYALW